MMPCGMMFSATDGTGTAHPVSASSAMIPAMFFVFIGPCPSRWIGSLGDDAEDDDLNPEVRCRRRRQHIQLQRVSVAEDSAPPVHHAHVPKAGLGREARQGLWL